METEDKVMDQEVMEQKLSDCKNHIINFFQEVDDRCFNIEALAIILILRVVGVACETDTERIGLLDLVKHRLIKNQTKKMK